MATKDTEVKELVVNTLTHKQFKAAQEAGTLSPYELYGTPDTSVRLPVLTPMWFDHITNDVSWLRADTFSWQSGDVYKAAYEHLVADYENAESETLYAWGNNLSIYFYTLSESPSVGDSVYTSSGSLYSSVYVTEVADGGIYVGGDNTESTLYRRDSSRDTKILQTDTIGDITITYYLADDGHKICAPDQESKIMDLYEQTGVAWYYLLDTENKQFKLPRSKHNKYASTLPVVGNGVSPTYVVPTGEGTLRSLNSSYKPLALGDSSGSGGAATLTTDPEKSGMVAQQEQDTGQYKYLYFYVGNFTQDAIEQTAGITTEQLNNKLDVGLGNAAAETKATIVGWGMPDYSAGVSTNIPYTAQNKCFVVAYASASNQSISFMINGEVVSTSGGTNATYYTRVGFCLDAGDVVSCTITGATGVVYPLKGVN